jgi:DNA-binding NtrC family response regulator
VTYRQASLLIVDDDRLVLAALRAVFRLETDYHVRLENDPREALHAVATIEVDVVISDYLMPYMDGVGFLEEVRRLRPSASLILLTGHADRARIERAIRDLGLEFMEKPWSNEALVRSVRSALARKGKEIRT